MAFVLTDAIKNPSPQLKAVIRFVDGIFATHDLKELDDILTEDFTRQMLPKTLGYPDLDKAGYLELCKTRLFHVVKDFKLTVHEVIETETKVVLHASSNAIAMSGRPYNNEYIAIVHVVKQLDGTYKLKLEKEFIDSKYSVEFFAEEERRREHAKDSD